MDDYLPRVTTKHDEIQLWAEAHRAEPEILMVQNGEGILRLNFPGPQDDVFLGETTQEEPIEWDQFFQMFEQQELAFQYNPDAQGEDLSNEYKFIKRSELFPLTG